MTLFCRELVLVAILMALPLSFACADGTSTSTSTSTTATPSTATAAPGTSTSWVVGMASLGKAGLSSEQVLVAEGLEKTLLSLLKRGGERMRGEDEEKGLAASLLQSAKETAARDVATAQTARDALLFKGYEDWKYESELEKADESLGTARDKYAKAGSDLGDFPNRLTLTLVKDNQDGKLLTAPPEGGERAFCVNAKLDALLFGSLTPFYGRLLLSLRLYSPWLKGDIYSERVAFSISDREAVLAGVISRFGAIISRSEPASVRVELHPPDAQLLIGGILQDNTKLDDLKLRPGAVAIKVTAPGFEPLEKTVDIKAGETLTLRVELAPSLFTEFSVRAFTADGTEVTGAQIHSGALYLGSTPATLSLPSGSLAQLSLATDRLGTTALVLPEPGQELRLPLVPLPDPGARPVDKARKSFYGALARFSISLPIAVLATGIMNAYYNSAVNEGASYYNSSYERARIVTAVGWGVSGTFLVETIWKFTRYLGAVGDSATPLVAHQ